MKIILLSIFSFLLTESYSQKGCHITHEVDQFNGKHKWVGGAITLIDGGISTVILERRDSIISFSLIIQRGQDPVCFREGAKMAVLFSDSTKIELVNDYDLNCKGIIKINIPHRSEHIKAFMAKPVKAIRFYSTDGYFDMDFSGDYMEQKALEFMNGTACLANAEK